MLNKVILIGNVGQDPEVKVMQSGSKVVNFSLATSESWKDKNGEKKENTEWHRVVVYGDKLPEIIGQYVKKGTKLYIEGAIKSRKYTDTSGQEKTITEIVIQNYSGTIKILSSRNSDNNINNNNVNEDKQLEKTDLNDDYVPF